MPSGTVTFLFSDIEGSTTLVQELESAEYRELLERHQRLLRDAFAAHRGIERGTEGDSFFVVFRDAPAAVAAAVEAQRALQSADWPRGREVRVRMGLHSGEGIRGGDDYIGLDVNRAARIAAAAHGGQVLVSESTRSLADRSLPTGVGVRDLGEHRLKGLAMPERVYQLVIDGLRAEFPALHSESARAGNLPPRLTTFVGRDAELAEVQRLLATSHLVTLVGSGGAGKTSLAIECARATAGDYADGAWFVALDAVRDPGLVASEIVGGLGLRDSGGRTTRERLEENLSRSELLLVLDNFEQVIEAADLVGELLAIAPGVRFLVTSRAPLRVTGEQRYPVGPLAVPARLDPSDPTNDAVDPIALFSVAAIRLFVDRAQQVQPAFRLTAENAAAVVDICARLDGLPLGIELAAARIPLLGVAGVRDRLAQRAGLPGAASRDAPGRQRTLHEAIAWSHDLLDVPARALFARLAVFVGGCALEEAVAVCGPASELGAEVIDTLATLIDQSLVTASPNGDHIRYGMLETIREFAAEQLAGRDERLEIQRRHALAYLALAEANAPALRTRRHRAVASRFAAESDNFQAALFWSIETADVEIGLRLPAALQNYWNVEGRIGERRATTLAILDMPGADAPSLWRMRALEAAGTLFYYSADNVRAAELYRAQLDLARELGDPRGTTDARFNLAWTEDWRGRAAEAQAVLGELATSFREIGDERSLARIELLRGGVLLTEDREQAGKVLEQAVARFHDLDDVIHEVVAASMIASVYLTQGDAQRAARAFVDVLVVAREIGDVVLMTVVLPVEAIAALELGRPESAATILGAFETQSRRYDVHQPLGFEQYIAGYDPLERARAALDPETFEAATRRGREMTLEEAAEYVLEMSGSLA
ncbi:MAG: adenylate/guanylate cyclase domain-containing protein [Chloroflexota bacterium]